MSTKSANKRRDGGEKPDRTYKALELTIDRAWDEKWSFNASYTLAYSEGNAEGPVNSPSGFSDTGRTEHFDDPFVNMGGSGPLPNDRRHQLKARLVYALSDSWEVGATSYESGPTKPGGRGNPSMARLRSPLCVGDCTTDAPTTSWPDAARQDASMARRLVHSLTYRTGRAADLDGHAAGSTCQSGALAERQ